MDAGFAFIGTGVFVFLAFQLGDVLTRRSNNQVKIQELKVQEAHELRLKAEAENNHSSLLK